MSGNWLEEDPHGKVPGYTGHIPGMRNYVVGQTYHSSTVNAHKADSLMRVGDNPAGLIDLVDHRPQGRDFLYAQVAKSTVPTAPPADYTMMPVPSASLPELTFKPRKFVDRKTFSEDVPELVKNGTKKVPGYTGHMHAAQHVFAQSFGRVARSLSGGAVHSTATSQVLADFVDDKPQGMPLQGDGIRIPGYTGCVPSKDNHIYGHTYAESTKLATTRAIPTLQSGGNASALPELTDYRPQGRVDLYTQRSSNGPLEFIDRPSNIPMHLAIRANKFLYTHKHGSKEPQVIAVNEGKHRLPGYTGHIRREKDMYGVTYGNLSRTLRSSM